MVLRFAPLLCAALAASACSPDYMPYRDAIKAKLLDPASAEFKDERIRTLWSRDGSRLSFYCTKVNSNNAFGGKSGFVPATVVVATTFKGDSDSAMMNEIFTPGKAFIDAKMSPGYYLDCLRPDTERRNGKLRIAYPTFGQEWGEDLQAEVDRDIPVISNEVAPEDR